MAVCVYKLLCMARRAELNLDGDYLRTLFLSILLASSAAFSLAADNASLSGKWKIHSNTMGNEKDIECTFVQTGNDLSGSCTTDDGNAIATGKVDGKKVTWSYKASYDGSPLTVQFAGTIDSAKISGSMTVPEFGVDGDFTATQSPIAASNSSPVAATSAEPAPAVAGGALSGKWKVHVSIAGNDSDSECTFIQQDNDLSGSCTAPSGPAKIHGKVDGKTISWSMETDYNGSPLTMKYSGTLDSASVKIAGTASVEQFGIDGDFTASHEN